MVRKPIVLLAAVSRAVMLFVYVTAALISPLAVNAAIADDSWTSAELVARCQSALHAPDGSPNKGLCVKAVGADSTFGKCMTPDPYKEDYATIVDWLAQNPKDGEDEMDGVARAEQALYGCK